MLNEDENGDDHIDHSFHPCLDCYVKSCLKMRISVKGKVQHLLTDHKELKKTKLPDANIQYLHLIDELCKLMESCHCAPRVFIDKCTSLMASDMHNIPLFSDKILKDFGEYHNISIMLRYLMCFFTWCDLSVIQELLKSCGYLDGVKLLENFKHQIIKPFTEYPVPNPHSLMIPSDTSPYTLMATLYEPKHSSLSLRHIEIIKTLITRSCEITSICCQFLAKNVDQIFYWLIPKSVVPLIVRKAQEKCTYLHKYGIKSMSIFPASESFFADNNKRFLIFSAEPGIDEVDLDVDKIGLNVNKVDPDIDKVDSDIDKVDSHVDKVGPDVDKVDPDVDKVDLHVDKVDPLVKKVSTNSVVGVTQLVC